MARSWLVFIAAFTCVLATLAAASASTFYWSGYGSSPLGFDGVGSIGYQEQGVGAYGVAYSPSGMRGGWSTTDSSGSFGYAYDTDMATAGNQGGFTSFGVHSQSFSGSFVNSPYGHGAYGGFIVGNPRVAAYPYYGGAVARAYSYPQGIPYSGYNAYGNYYPSNWY